MAHDIPKNKKTAQACFNACAVLFCFLKILLKCFAFFASKSMTFESVKSDLEFGEKDPFKIGLHDQRMVKEKILKKFSYFQKTIMSNVL